MAEPVDARHSKCRRSNPVRVRVPPRPLFMPAHKLPDKDFKWTPELAYIVGLITTDGNLSSNGRSIVMRSSEIPLLQTFKKCLRVSNKIGRTSPCGYSRKCSYRIQIGMVQFYRWLLKIGLTPAKTYTLGALAIPNEYFPDFLRGHLDGDGSITIYKDFYNTFKNQEYVYTRLWLRFISVSKHHIIWLRKRIGELLGVHGHLWADKWKNKHVPMWVLKFGKKDSIRLLHWMYYSPDIPCLLRKRRKAEKFLTIL